MADLLPALGEGARTGAGFFWKSGWAFVLGYFISAMIQAFVPKGRLTRHMGDAGVRSISLATAFGSISSSCSFAALSAARALILKGAHFVAGVAFMFASTNLEVARFQIDYTFWGWDRAFSGVAFGSSWNTAGNLTGSRRPPRTSVFRGRPR